MYDIRYYQAYFVVYENNNPSYNGMVFAYLFSQAVANMLKGLSEPGGVGGLLTDHRAGLCNEPYIYHTGVLNITDLKSNVPNRGLSTVSGVDFTCRAWNILDTGKPQDWASGDNGGNVWGRVASSGYWWGHGLSIN